MNPSETHEQPRSPGATRATPAARRRVIAVLAALLTVAAGLGIRAVADGPVTKYGGDALYTLLLYTLVLVVAPRARPAIAATVALAASWAVEFFQITGIPAELATRSVLARLVLGTSFNPPDLFWYAVGGALGWAVHALAERTSRTGLAGLAGRADRAVQRSSRR
ncbi:DUF2809 domain-containing protein [Microtetraspora sp. NBRC 16547]|uniref:DUF2809 domain-containing protein n=1 Tax=Microtetraspora sp. NBRC 16547 TaxID=3030993 RepID=UPI0024A07A21|nr:DUF2809 domain-containing protein [Microtetraspora sp. NBRC 16547]GLX01484.1 hypothetical protein Misp02_55700 [Microtetraspora sp. NBRC 16547]